MNASAVALIGFALWTVVLVLILVTPRSILTLSGKRAANSYAPDGSDVGPFSERVSRAHANCTESLPVFAAIVLTALVTGNAAVTDPLALWVLGARIAQSSIHLITTAAFPVLVRFTLASVQWAAAVYWSIELLRILL